MFTGVPMSSGNASTAAGPVKSAVCPPDLGNGPLGTSRLGRLVSQVGGRGSPDLIAAQRFALSYWTDSYRLISSGLFRRNSS